MGCDQGVLMTALRSSSFVRISVTVASPSRTRD
jgi:hypothetical protein